MPRRNPTPEEFERGTSQAIDAVTTLLRNLRRAQGELVDAALDIGFSWPEIAELTGHASGKAAEAAQIRWREGRP